MVENGGNDRALGFVGKELEVGFVDDGVAVGVALDQLEEAVAFPDAARGIIGVAGPDDPLRALGSEVLFPTEDMLVPDLGAQVVLRGGTAIFAVGGLDEVGEVHVGQALTVGGLL